MTWFVWKDKQKTKKKEHDESHKGKRKRAFKAEAKEVEESFREGTKSIKMGTYKTGSTIEETVVSNKGANDGVMKKQHTVQRAPCQCGAAEKHYNWNHAKCLFNPKNMQLSEDSDK